MVSELVDISYKSIKVLSWKIKKSNAFRSFIVK